MKKASLPRKNNFTLNGEEAEHYGNAINNILTGVSKVKNGEADVTNNYNTYGETQTSNGLSGKTIGIVAAIAAIVIIVIVVIKRKK